MDIIGKNKMEIKIIWMSEIEMLEVFKNED